MASLRRLLLVAALGWAQASTCGEIKSAYKGSSCCYDSLGKDTNYSVTSVSTTKRALIVVDTQDCFLNYSLTLPVANSYEILPILNELRDPASDYFSIHIRSQDYHPTNHISFGPTFGLYGFYNYPNGIPMMCTEDSFPDSCCPMLDPSFCPVNGTCPTYSEELIEDNPACSICFPDGPYGTAANDTCKQINQAMWPDHCRSPFEGGDAGFPSALDDRVDDIILRKGQAPYIDGYSVFQDNAGFKVGQGIEAGFDFNLHERFQAAGIEEVYVTGLAYDFCVAWSAKDAAALGYSVTVIEDASAAIADSTAESETELMEAAGVDIVESFSERRRLKAEQRRLKAHEIQSMRDAGVKVVKSKDILAKMRKK